MTENCALNSLSAAIQLWDAPSLLIFRRQRTLQLTLTVPVLVGVSELSNFFSSAPGVLLVINEMICLYLVITRLRTTNQLSTNQPSHAVKPVNQ